MTSLPELSSRLAAVVISCALALALTPSAFAHPPASRDIAISQLDLLTQAGAEAAYLRLHDTARYVCRIENQFGADADRSIRRCTQRSLEDAVNQLDSPQLTALHAHRNTEPKLANMAGQAPS